MTTCELCGERPARFVCSRCGRAVCPSCFKPSAWLCARCYEEAVGKARPALAPVGVLGPEAMRWVIAGSALVFLGFILLLIASTISGKGAVVIFPLPVVFVGDLVLFVALLMVTLLFVALFLALVIGFWRSLTVAW